MCQLGFEGIVSKRLGSPSLRALTALGQEQEPAAGSVETVGLVLTVVILAYGIVALALTIGRWALKGLRSSRIGSRSAVFLRWWTR
jgi:hypothetical protein